MRMRPAASLLLGVIIILFSGVMAQAQDETPGQQSQIVASIPTGGYSCGRAAAYFVNCQFPVNIGGTTWLCASPMSSGGPTGFINFDSSTDLGQAKITGMTATYNSLHQILTLSVTFSGTTTDGDNGTYAGAGSFTFSYFRATGGSGRGGGYPGYIQLMQSGSLTVTYN